MPLPPPTSLGLPAKPGSARNTASNLPTAERASPATSSGPAPICSICKAPAKYTCPRCAARSCSLPCSKAHKENKGCSGVRDPAAFVPLAKFTQGTWDGDYAWLESTRRQVATFGEGLSPVDVRGAERGRGRGRGRGGAGVQTRQRKPKTDGLRWALAQVGAEVDVLPDGMQKRRQNQSSWNHK